MVVRETGLEPAWYCYRQPLKLVRLPISPLAHCSWLWEGSQNWSSENLRAMNPFLLRMCQIITLGGLHGAAIGDMSKPRMAPTHIKTQ
jgi:hypothetical protein